jgi:hypothetical protein
VTSSYIIAYVIILQIAGNKFFNMILFAISEFCGIMMSSLFMKCMSDVRAIQILGIIFIASVYVLYVL